MPGSPALGDQAEDEAGEGGDEGQAEEITSVSVLQMAGQR